MSDTQRTIVDDFRDWEATHNRDNYGRFDAFKAGFELATSSWPSQLAPLREGITSTKGIVEEIRVIGEKILAANEALRAENWRLKLASKNCSAFPTAWDYAEHLEKQVGLFAEVVRVVAYTDRSRGYPTGAEWAEIVKLAVAVLAKVKGES